MARKLTKRQKREINKTIKNHWKVFLVIAIILVAIIMLGYCLGWFDLLKNKFFDEERVKPLKVAFLDVGQGDCMIIELPDGKTMIIDSGDSVSDQTVISDYATANNITAFDYLLLTHQDADHVSNMDWVLKNYTVRYIFRPNNYSNHTYSASLPAEFNPVIEDTDAHSTTKGYAEFMVEAYNEGCTVEIFNKDSDFTNKIICGDKEYSYTFNFLTPTANRANILYSNPNDYSPLLLLEFAGRRILFTGDAEEDVLEEYLTTYSNSYHNVDVLKVGHHGSHNATSPEFISAIDPEYAVIQCGYGNNYGHPHDSVLTTLRNHDDEMVLYRNDCNKDIVLTITASGDMSWDIEDNDLSDNWLSGYDLSGEGSVASARNNIVMDLLEGYIISYRKRII